MSKKERTDRIRQQDAKRQQNKRDREAAHRQAVGAEKFTWETYAGTRADMECIRQVGVFEEVEEGLTLAIRYMAGWARRDPQAFQAAMDPRNPL